MKLRPLALLVILSVVLAACGDGNGDSADGDVSTTAQPDAATTTAGAETTDGVNSSETDLGTILVDPDGFTLYVFTADADGESTCYDACADLWPPVPADTAISSDLDGSMFGSTTRTDGTEQLTVGGMPVYLYTPDTSPGDTNGQGFNGVWFVVGADGNMIEAAADDGALVGYDY